MKEGKCRPTYRHSTAAQGELERERNAEKEGGMNPQIGFILKQAIPLLHGSYKSHSEPIRSSFFGPFLCGSQNMAAAVGKDEALLEEMETYKGDEDDTVYIEEYERTQMGD